MATFTSLINQLTEEFTGREWIFQRIQNWLSDSQSERILLLVGDPGSGKSAIAARLAQFSLAAAPDPEFPHLTPTWLAYVHFCQNGLHDTLAPLEFVEALSTALINRYPKFTQALSSTGLPGITIDASQTVNHAEAGANITAVSIGSLIVENQSEQKAFDQLVRRPLNELYESGFTEPVIILVDSLDEALTYDPEVNILALIQRITEDPANLPGSLRFICTSRPDKRVLQALRVNSSPGAVRLIKLASNEPDVDDVRRFALLRLSGRPEPARSQLAEQVASAGKGNFLYARYVLKELTSNTSQDMESVGLPEGLEGIYQRFIERELARNPGRWEERYKPLLGMLAVARGQGISRLHLEEAMGLPQAETRAALNACGQFLTGSQPDGPFRLYHQSFRDFLLRNPLYSVSPQEASQEIAEYFLKAYGGDWWSCPEEDAYAWQYSASHLSEAIALLTNPAQRPRREELTAQLVNLLNDANFLGVNFGHGAELFPSRLKTLVSGKAEARLPDGNLRGQAEVFQKIGSWLMSSRERVFVLVFDQAYDRAGLLARWLQQAQSQEGYLEAPEQQKQHMEVIEHFCTPSEDPTLVLCHLAYRLAGRFSGFGHVFTREIGDKIAPYRSEEFTPVAIDRRIRWAIVDTLRRLPVDKVFETAILRPLQNQYSTGANDLLLAIDSAEFGLLPEPLLHPDLLNLPVRLLLTCQPGSPVLQLIRQFSPEARFDYLESSPLQQRRGDQEQAQTKGLSRFQDVDPHSLIWLALPPGWTEELADACNFPAGPGGLEDFRNRAVAAGWCEQFLSFDTQGRETCEFWMPDAQRTEAIREVVEQSGRSFIIGEANEIGRQILLAEENGGEVPQRLHRWAELAIRIRQDGRDAGRWLEEQIQQSASAGNSIDALRWVEVGSRLGQIVGGEIETAVLVESRRIELVYRQAADARSLKDYLVLQSPFEALQALLEGGDGQEAWAVHYMGPSGFGKTSLLRYISVKARELNVIPCRVDFEYLHPDYPGRNPAGLIDVLAQEMKYYLLSPRQSRILEELRYHIDAFRDRLRWEEFSLEKELAFKTPQFEEIIYIFADLIKSLPLPLILMFDNADELRRFSAEEAPTGILAIFEILEHIHRLVPSLRVILAGRRPLASEGYRWKVDQKGPKPPARPYLRLVEMQGFNKEEALQFLKILFPGLAATDPQVVSAILEASQQTGFEPQISQRAEAHYIPFTLALYATWIKEDPYITAEMISLGSSDAYIETRIIGRIQIQSLMDVLPAAVLLCQFDREMLRLALSGDGNQVDEAFEKLSEQEWVQASFGDLESVRALTLDPYIRTRLLAYYQRQGRLESAQAQLAPGLVRMVRDLPLHELKTYQISAALRLASVDQATELFQDIARKLTEDRDRIRSTDVFSRLLGEDELSLPAEHPLRNVIIHVYRDQFASWL